MPIFRQNAPVRQFRFVQFGQGINNTFPVKLQPLNQPMTPDLYAAQPPRFHIPPAKMVFTQPLCFSCRSYSSRESWQ